MKILVTGGTGYIGSHTCVELLKLGMDVVVVDNLVNSSMESMKRVQAITGKRPYSMIWTFGTRRSSPGSLRSITSTAPSTSPD